MSVTRVRRRPVDGSSTLIVARGKTAPEVSVTVPWMLPEEPTPWAYARLPANSKHRNNHDAVFMTFLLRKRNAADEVWRISMPGQPFQRPWRADPDAGNSCWLLSDLLGSGLQGNFLRPRFSCTNSDQPTI